jgi:hypothetical protein
MPSPTALPPLEQICLEDSYLLGILAKGGELRLRVEFALAGDHPRYTPPLPGEQHCYCEGDIVISGIEISRWQAGRAPNILIGPDASIDLGGIAMTTDGAGYRIETEWFEMSFRADAVDILLDATPR